MRWAMRLESVVPPMFSEVQHLGFWTGIIKDSDKAWLYRGVG